MNRYTHCSRNAFVLSIVLWIVASLLLGVMALSLLSKDSVTLSNDLKDKLQAQLKAQNTLEELIFYIITADYDNNSIINKNPLKIEYQFPEKIIVDNRWYDVNQYTKIRLKDTSSLLNIRTYGGSYIAAVATTKKQRQLKFIIEDSINDWRDEDEISRLNGAEDIQYKTQKKVSYKVRNISAIQDVEELRLINGIDKLNDNQWKNLRDKVYYGRTSMINLALVDIEVLSSLLNISESYAQELIKIRDEELNQFIQIVSKLPKFDDTMMGFHLSRQFIIEIETQQNNAKSIIKALIDFKQHEKELYTIIKYSND